MVDMAYGIRGMDSTPKRPDGLSSPISARIEAWTAELEALRGNPTVRRFLEIRRLILDDPNGPGFADSPITPVDHPMRYRFGPPSDRGILGTSNGLGIPKNELSALKADDLQDPLFRVPRSLRG